MYNIKIKFIKSIFHVRINIHFYLFLASLISIALQSLKLMNLDAILGSELNLPLNIFLRFLWIGSSIFVMLFLPSYPFFFKIYKSVRFNVLEKFCLTSVFNLSFYAILGYIGNSLGFALNAFYFFSFLVVFYFSLIIIILILKFKRKEKVWFKTTTNTEEFLIKYDKFSFYDYIKKKISWNGILLIIFMILFIILFYLNVDIFVGTDAWYHVLLIKIITNANSLPLNEYFGAMGFHIIGAVFYYFSAIDIIVIPNVFLFITLPITLLILYNITMRIFSNKSLAIFGIYLLLITTLGFKSLTLAFWPSSIVFIQGLTIFFLLYVRLRNFVKEEKPNWRAIRANMAFNYLYITFIFIALYLSHSLIALVFLFSFIWVLLIYLIKSAIRGFDFVLMVILFGIFLIFYTFNVSSGHLVAFTYIFTLPWTYLLFGAIFIAIIGGAIVLWLRTQITFKEGRFNLILMGKKFRFYTVIEKIVIPLVVTLTVLFSTGYFVANLLLFNLNIISVFVGFEIIIVVIFAMWGLVVFQNKPKGKPLYLWLIYFLFLVLGGFIFDIMRGNLSFFSRLFYLASPIMAIGFISYIYKLIKIGKINLIHVKSFLIIFICFSSTASLLEFYTSLDFYSVNDNELSAVSWYLQNSDDKNVLVLEFGWSPVFAYYDYPYNEKNSSLPLTTTQYYVTFNGSIINPDNHIDESGKNVLKELKKNYNADIFILLSKYYLTTTEMGFIGELTEEQVERYYSLTYLNRIFSVKSENGDSIPYYWVI